MAAVVFKQFNLFFNAVVHADIIAVDTDRPVNRVRADAQHLLDFVHQIKRVTAVTVKLVYKSKYRQLLRWQTQNSFFVCGSTPLAQSISITALSAASK